MVPSSLLKAINIVIMLLSLLIFSCKDRRGKIEGDPLKDAIRGMDTTQNLWARLVNIQDHRTFL
jgi:hypothetical protein